MLGMETYTDARGNRIIGSAKQVGRCQVTFASENCLIEIGAGVTCENVIIIMEAPGGRLSIGDGSLFKGYARVGRNSSIDIGRKLYITAGGVFSACEESSITIGDDCMFAGMIEIRSDHAHPIFDLETGRRTNKARSVTIGDHVWLSARSVVFPGSEIGSGSIIGHSSLVAGLRVPKNSIAAGNPARVVRRNVLWDKRHVGKYVGLETIADLALPEDAYGHGQRFEPIEVAPPPGWRDRLGAFAHHLRDAFFAVVGPPRGY